MRKENGVKAILIIIVACLLINIGISTYNSINQKKLSIESQERRDNYKSNIMRFPIKISKGEYEVVDYGKNYLIDEENGLKLFKEAAENIYLNGIDTKYSEYIVTEESTYVCVDIEYADSYMVFIEHPVPISDNSLNNLRNFMREIDDDSIMVLPFNDGIHCFVDGSIEQYIFNIESGELLWTRGCYYESPMYNPIEDTITCGGDLSATDYVFNKYGELIETKEYGKGFLILGIFNLAAIFLILFIIQQMVHKNVKNIAIKIITNIFLVPIMLFIAMIVLWVFMMI